MAFCSSAGMFHVHKQGGRLRGGVAQTPRAYRCAHDCPNDCAQYLDGSAAFSMSKIKKLREEYFPIEFVTLRKKRRKPGPEPEGEDVNTAIELDPQVGRVVVSDSRSLQAFKALVMHVLIGGASKRPTTDPTESIRGKTREDRLKHLRSSVSFDHVAIHSPCEAPIYVCDRFFALLLGHYNTQHSCFLRTWKTMRDKAADHVLDFVKHEHGSKEAMVSNGGGFSKDSPAVMRAATWLAEVACNYASCMPTNQEVRSLRLYETMFVLSHVRENPHTCVSLVAKVIIRRFRNFPRLARRYYCRVRHFPLHVVSCDVSLNTVHPLWVPW